MSLDADFRSKLVELVGPSVPVQQNYASADTTQPRVWFQRQNAEGELLLSGQTLFSNTTTYAVEVAGLDPDATGLIADHLQNAQGLDPAGLDGFRGAMGGTIVLGMFVDAANDNYEPRGVDVDDGYHVFAFEVRVMT